MDNQSKASIVIAKTLVLLFVLVIVAIFLTKTPTTSSTVRVQEGRVFENAIPDKVPIKINIKKEKEKSFKDLKNEKWLSEFELELTNTSDKPIYFIYITMGTGVKWGGTGNEVVSPLHYGRPELGDIVTKAGPDDVPIKPGETFVLKMGEVPGWEMGVRQGLFEQAKKLRAELQVISFGDGTGYFGTELYPPASKRQSLLNHQQPEKTRAGPRGGLVGKLGAQPGISGSINKPASFLPAKFLSDRSSNLPAITVDAYEPVTAVAKPSTSCLFPECVVVVPWTGYVCWDNEGRPACKIQNRPNRVIGRREVDKY